MLFLLLATLLPVRFAAFGPAARVCPDDSGLDLIDGLFDVPLVDSDVEQRGRECCWYVALSVEAVRGSEEKGGVCVADVFEYFVSEFLWLPELWEPFDPVDSNAF